MTTEYVWTPPGASDEELAEFLNLRPGIPDYMRESVITWVLNGKTSYDWANITWLIHYQTVARDDLGIKSGTHIKNSGLGDFLRKVPQHTFVKIIHFILSELNVPYDSSKHRANNLEKILASGGSSFAVGIVQGRFGLVERIPGAVADTVEAVISSADKASALLAKAWELAFGINKSPSHAYFDAVKAVEVYSCPLFSPKDKEPTLGKDINVLRNKPEAFEFVMQGSKHTPAPEHVLSMMQLLWHSQTDRHGSDDYADVTVEEAQAAVLLASTLVGWLAKGMLTRKA